MECHVLLFSDRTAKNCGPFSSKQMPYNKKLGGTLDGRSRSSADSRQVLYTHFVWDAGMWHSAGYDIYLHRTAIMGACSL